SSNGARAAVPAKMTSSISSPRRPRADVSPITQRSASTRLDLPQPFGPTMPVRPGSTSSSVGCPNDLKPERRSLVTCTGSGQNEGWHAPSYISRALGVKAFFRSSRPLGPPRLPHVASGPQRRASGPLEQRIDQLGERIDVARAGVGLAVDHEARGRADVELVLPVETGLQNAVG